jgi:hypothetical protein
VTDRAGGQKGVVRVQIGKAGGTMRHRHGGLGPGATFEDAEKQPSRFATALWESAWATANGCPFRFLVAELNTLARPNYFSTTRTGGLGT